MALASEISEYCFAWHRRHTDKVAILEVETIQLVTSLFGIHNILIYNESCPLCIAADSLTDLTFRCISQGDHTRRSKQASCIALAHSTDGESDIPYGSKLAKEIEELLRCDIVATVFVSGVQRKLQVCQFPKAPGEEPGSAVQLYRTNLRFFTKRALRNVFVSIIVSFGMGTRAEQSLDEPPSMVKRTD